MDYAVFALLTGLLQIAGAVYAFNHDGVLAKMLGLLFCVVAAICIMASVVFFNDEKANRRKGNKQ